MADGGLLDTRAAPPGPGGRLGYDASREDNASRPVRSVSTRRSRRPGTPQNSGRPSASTSFSASWKYVVDSASSRPTWSTYSS